MSAFTDEDLERWKGYTPGMRVPFNALGEVKALIARLEAAEYALMRFYVIPKDEWTSGIREAVDKWRKAKGE